MSLAKCPRCGTLFNKLTAMICNTCIEPEDRDRDKIRTILDEQPGLSAKRVAEEAEVELDVVLRMLDQGLLTSADIAHDIKCGHCGAPAISHSKRLCHSCLSKLNQKMLAAQKSLRSRQKKETEFTDELALRDEIEQKRIW